MGFRRLLPHLLVAFAPLAGSACGSSNDAAQSLAAAGPTADEVAAAQAGSQMYDGDMPSRGAATGSRSGAVPGGAGRAAARAAGTDGDPAVACAASALEAGQELDGAARASLQASLMGSVSGRLQSTTSSSTRDASSNPVTGSSQELGGSTSGSTSVLYTFGPPYCDFGAVALSGNQLSVVDSSGDAQVIVDLTLTRSSDVTKVSSADLTKATYEVADQQATATSASFRLFANEHRVRTRTADGTVDLDVVTTATGADGLSMSTTFTAADGNGLVLPQRLSRTLVSGTARTTHKLAHFYADHTYHNLQTDQSGSCSCPISGGLTQEVYGDDGRSAVHEYTFQGCGEAAVVSKVTVGGVTTTAQSAISFQDCS